MKLIQSMEISSLIKDPGPTATEVDFHGLRPLEK